MATALASPPPPPARPQKRFTVAEYHKLLDVGVVTAKDRCELIRGYIVEKPVINPPHATVVTKLMQQLVALLGAKAAVRVGLPITLSDSEPHPDLVVAAGVLDDYETAHPRPGQIQLVVEVADSTVAEDQTSQLELYAEAGLLVYWIVNIPDRRVEVYTQPRGGKSPAYRARRDFGPRDSVPVVLAGKDRGAIPVREILPR